MNFKKKTDAIEFLSDHLMQRGFSTQMSKDVAQELSKLFHSSPAKPKGFQRLVGNCWAIRDDDLKLIDFICSSLLAGVVFVATTNPVIVVGAGAVAATFKLIYAFMKKGARLTQNQHQILLGLKKSSSGYTIEELTDWLSVSYRTKGWNRSVVEAELKALQAIPLNDGTVVQLVNRDNRDKWYPAGV
jgi:hypothetical protein